VPAKEGLSPSFPAAPQLGIVLDHAPVTGALCPCCLQHGEQFLIG
jgi:hypothetical protein